MTFSQHLQSCSKLHNYYMVEYMALNTILYDITCCFYQYNLHELSHVVFLLVSLHHTNHEIICYITWITSNMCLLLLRSVAPAPHQIFDAEAIAKLTKKLQEVATVANGCHWALQTTKADAEIKRLLSGTWLFPTPEEVPKSVAVKKLKAREAQWARQLINS